MGFTFTEPTDAIICYQKAEHMAREALILKSQFGRCLGKENILGL